MKTATNQSPTSPLRVAVVSDLHGNLTALEAVLSDLRLTAPDLVVHGGDLASHGPRPAEVIDRIRGLGWPGVRGNTDEMLWKPETLGQLAVEMPERQRLREVLFHELAPATAALIGVERLEWLRSLPDVWAIDGLSVLHASPNNLWRAPLSTAGDDELFRTYTTLGTRRVVYGHIHHGFIRALHSLTVVNSGSVSVSYDGDPRASYALVDDDRVSLRRVAYDIEAEIAHLAQSGYPRTEWLGRMIRTGRFVPPT